MCVVVVAGTQVGRERKEREREKRKSTLSIPYPQQRCTAPDDSKRCSRHTQNVAPALLQMT